MICMVAEQHQTMLLYLSPLWPKQESLRGEHGESVQELICWHEYEFPIS